MDSLISTALEEICSRGATGLSVSSLWSTLTPTPTNSLKIAIWKNLLSIPSLQFISKNDTPFTSTDPKIQRFEDAEKLNLKIVANNHLRDCFVGLYDAPSTGICPLQRRTLERLAISRTIGVTQNQLAKEFGIEGNNYFYRVRNLECRKLIVRQPAVVKTKEAAVDCEGGESKNSSIVSTNLIYLSRYAKHLGVQQRFEINKGDIDDTHGFEDDVAIKDFLPAMKAISDKLQEANDKVLIVSDIKQSLGYTGRSGHRAWRNICRRLKDAGIVESFDAKVNGKVEHCLRLLKKFSLDNFEKKILGCRNDCPNKQSVKFGRRSQQTEQLVELPIDHQIYDMIDAKRTEGATMIEVCGRLGLDRKRNDSRLHNLFSRFGMHVQAENHKKTVAFRVWTPENSTPKESNAFLDKSKSVLGGNDHTLIVGNCDVPDGSTEALVEYNHSAVEIDFATSKKPNDNKEIEAEPCNGSPDNDQTNHELLSPEKVPEFFIEPDDATSNAKIGRVSAGRDTDPASSETTLLKLPDSGSYQAYPYLPLTVDGALREQRIVERLQDEKFLLRVELHKWLVSLEKDKHTSMDRKTIDRLLSKLQQEGRCKCVEINLPAVTNCTSHRPIMVVLHPSVQSFPPELLGEIHDRLRSFEKEIRVQASSKLKVNDAIPVLSGLTRTHPRRNAEEQAVKAEAMRANGFVWAKMVRAKLLHNFLWSFLSSLPGGDDVLSAGPCECTQKYFVLESAIKVLPVELFLKVVGTTHKFDKFVESSKRGLLLSDLPVEEYKLLMDTRATGRLSLIIDILRRLKLIRLIRNGQSGNGVKIHHESIMYAMELRPYIEEPLLVVATSNLSSLDLRPRIRHDFILSNREAVDDYWKTLEYCYAAVDPRAALHAFPGSSVPEVFHPLFWTSVRFTSAHQRAELLKWIVKDDLKKRISCEECEKIARDLNLSLQQVLRAYYGKHRQRLNIFQGVVSANEHHQASKRSKLPSSTKRKRSRESSSVKRGRLDAVNKQLPEQGLIRSADTTDQFIEERPIHRGQHADHLLAYCENDHLDSVEELGSDPNNKQQFIISQNACSDPLPNRQRRFSWTDSDDRQLLIQYTRHRAVLGSKINRIDWNKVPDLPAPPKACAKRVSSLKRNIQFRKALMNLCTMLSKRYAKHLQKTQSTYLNNSGSQVLVRCSTTVDSFSNDIENAEGAGFEEEQWDDFSDKNIKQAFEGVLLYKQIAKMQASKGFGTASEELSNLNTNMNSLESELILSNNLNEDIHKDSQGIHKDPAQRSRRHRLHQKFIKCLKGGTFVGAQVHKSLAVSNAVELLKLVFLSTSATPELQNHLAETLRRYSEHDIFAAFSYLREKKVMIGGDGDQPFELSQQFLQNISKSLFPSNTGKRAAKFSGWLFEREKDLVEGGINLTADLQCGEIFQLFALVSSGQLSISPCVPDEGVGEAEDVRGSKRKAEDFELCDGDKSKKLKSLADSELISRREKGFPGITVLLNRASILTVDAVDMFKDVLTCNGELNQSDKLNDDLSQTFNSTSFQHGSAPEILNFDCILPAARWSSESPWEAMAGFAEYLMLKPSDPEETNLFSPEVFRTVCMAIQKAGDQGLSSDEVSQIAGENRHNHIIDVLQAFGCVLKVNAYDSVHVVDALYHSKYFLTSLASVQDLDPHSVQKSSERNKGSVSWSESHDVVGTSSRREAIVSDNCVHKVTILNLPDEDGPLTETQWTNVHGGSLQENVLPKQNNDIITQKLSSNELHMPILPWINGDGSMNKVVYNGLVRRVLGIVMRNPGLLEENIIHQIDVLNPQSCKSLLELMILDKHVIVRKMHQTTSSGPPALLQTLLGSSIRESKSVYRKHFFANPMSASML
ncbi:uncharacterized protein LOC8284661 isoform X1 [Ricinus communis]|uniref:uncharacterized protein LOC8284661 isoform X1 n=1 Tax=Ricinus communis TaxID=3988 RepID=UPI00201A65F9|nr:uncharacterized protein LOC8284661 isoform X1 [Ricinus communis]